MTYWDKKTVLITGAHGFVGTNLVNYIRKSKLGCKLLTPTRVELNLTNEEAVRKYFSMYKPQIVLHLAGRVGGIGINKEIPAQFFYDNLMMGTLVMHHAQLNGCQKLVALAAGCGYPKFAHVPYKEEDFWKDLPDENSIGYSMAKKNLIIQSWTYRQQYGFNSVVLLPANLYGPYDNFNLETSHVVPALIRKFTEAKKLNKGIVDAWGTGSATREFLYVKDTVKAIVDMAELVNESGPFNLGTGVETSVKELIEIIAKNVEYKGEIAWDVSKPDGQPKRFYDMTRFKNALGYVPSTSLSQGISETVEWYEHKGGQIEK